LSARRRQFSWYSCRLMKAVAVEWWVSMKSELVRTSRRYGIRDGHFLLHTLALGTPTLALARLQSIPKLLVFLLNNSKHLPTIYNRKQEVVPRTTSEFIWNVVNKVAACSFSGGPPFIEHTSSMRALEPAPHPWLAAFTRLSLCLWQTNELCQASNYPPVDAALLLCWDTWVLTWL
jgi:hypothetical protein